MDRQRFDALVDRSGEHHIWMGAINPERGTGRAKVKGRQMTAHRLAWELAHGSLPASARVLTCPDEPACVRIDHLRCEGAPAPPEGGVPPGLPRLAGARARRGSGSMRKVEAGVWKLSVTVPSGPGRRQRRVHRMVHVANARQAAQELASFVSEVRSAPVVPTKETHTSVMNDAVARFLSEHLRDEKGREERTIRSYHAIHDKWFAPEIGRRLVRDVDRAAIDRAFGKMRRAGLSRSRLNQARSLYAPFFKWAVSRGLTWANPMVGFELPTSRHVATERTPPEVAELELLLREAVAVVPDVAPVLALGAVTGMRRGELVGLRRSRIHREELRITVDSAVDGHRVKTTKTRRERSFYVDDETMAMLARVCEQQDELAAEAGSSLVADPFLFSLALDGSQPMPPDHLTKRVAILKPAPRDRAEVSRDDRTRGRGAPSLPPASNAPAAREPRSRAGRGYDLQGHRRPLREERAVGLPCRRVRPAPRTGPGAWRSAPLRRLDPRPPQVHVERTPRRRLQHQRGRPAPGPRPASPDQALREEPAVVRPASRRTPRPDSPTRECHVVICGRMSSLGPWSLWASIPDVDEASMKTRRNSAHRTTSARLSPLTRYFRRGNAK